MLRNKKFKNSVSMILATSLLLGTLSGCGGSSSTPSASQSTGGNNGGTPATASAAPENITYPIANAGKFTYGLTLSTSWSDRFDSFDKIPLGQALEKDTGYDMEMVHVENKQAMNLLLASGDLPDAIAYNFQSNYTGGEAKAVQDGLIYPMSEEFVQKYAPDYWKVISSNPDILKQVKTPDGQIYGFAFILGDELLKGGQGLIIRDDWAAEVGIPNPETADDYYNLLKAYKEKKGVEIPLAMNIDFLKGALDRGMLTSPFGLVTMDTYVDNNEVKIGYAEPEFKEVLAYLKKLYADGLLDPNFATLDKETITANMLTGKSAASSGAAGSILGTWLNTNKDVPDYSLGGIKNLVANKGETPLYGHYNTDVVGTVAVITTSAKNPEEIAKFFNYGYTDAGHLLYNFGTEGVSYEMKDGKPVYTDLVLNNPNGLTLNQALSEHVLAVGNGPFVQDKDYLLQYYQTQEQKDALVQWTDNSAKKYKLPRITIAQDSVGEYSSLTSELQTYRDEMIIKFIRGEESLDNYDKYIATLESMGLNRLKEIIQAGVDSYNAM